MVRSLCGALGRHRAEILSVYRTVSALVLARWMEHIMAVLYLLKPQKSLSVDVGDGASVDCP